MIVSQLFILLFWPWNGGDYYSSAIESLPQQYRILSEIARNGYWPWDRWNLRPQDRGLIQRLQAEISASHITRKTHILAVTRTMPLEYSLAAAIAVQTGIAIDIVALDYQGDGFFYQASRVKRGDELESALSQRPRYILFDGPEPLVWGKFARNYEIIYAAGNDALYRLRS